MALDPHSFMSKMCDRISFAAADRELLQSSAGWGAAIAPDMADHFYTFMGRDEEMNTILNASEGRVHRLRETFLGSSKSSSLIAKETSLLIQAAKWRSLSIWSYISKTTCFLSVRDSNVVAPIVYSENLSGVYYVYC